MARWTAQTLGMEVTGSFPVPGVSPSAMQPPPSVALARRCDLALAANGEVSGLAGDAGLEPLFRQNYPDGSPSVTLELADGHGYRLWSRNFGSYLIASDGRRVLADPPAQTAPAYWQRLLVGHALPMACLVQGLEVFHASAVSMDGAAIAIAAPSHGGKSSLAIRLALRGGDLLTDDALALEPDGVRVLAHPGPSIVNIRHAQWDLLSDAERLRLGAVVGIDADAVRVVVRRSAAPVPLRAFVFVSRGPGGSGVAIGAVPDPATALLLSTHNFVIRTPVRMAAQLGTCAAVAQHAQVLQARVAPEVGAGELAERLAARLS